MSDSKPQIWADASIDQSLRIAYGAFIIEGGATVCHRLKSKTSIDAEFELMTIAVKAGPVGSILFTDLVNWQHILRRWNYWQLSGFKAAVERKKIEVQYVPRDARAAEYYECHRVALHAVRSARKTGARR